MRFPLAATLGILLWAQSGGAQVQAGKTYPGPITLAVDAARAPQRIFHAHLTIPASPGPLTLLYAKWIPGEHGPTGPIADLTGLKITAQGRTLPWKRDNVEMYALQVQVPPESSAIDVELDYTSPAELEQGFTAGSTATSQMAVLSWNWVLLYPAGYPAEAITYRARLQLPPDWRFGTALPVASQTGNTIEFQPVSLYTLVDSPVIAGRYLRVVKLTSPGAWPPAEMDIAADSAAALEMDSATERHYKQLVAEAATAFGATHYRDYHFLLSLSDHVAHFGLEHHESNDSRTRERSLIDAQQELLMASLLPHEYTHSWNGKYRRPAGLTTPDYSEPMEGDLLWVYEGLTNYVGDILAARCGLNAPEQYRDYLALTAARMDNRSGRTWRPLIDTVVAAQVLYDAPQPWTNWRRGTDFYPEGDLLWLEADTTIRDLSGGRRSLDDFLKSFAGPPSLGRDQVPAPAPYTFDDLVNVLNRVAPYDWRKFWNDRLWSTSPHAPWGGLEASGWTLTYDENPSELVKAGEGVRKLVNLEFSLGLTLDEDGRVLDVAFDRPAHQAGIAPGMILVAVNGRAWSREVVHDALRAGKQTSTPLQLLVRNDDYYSTVSVDYHGGDRYPHLVRNSRPDLLTDIVRQHAPKAP
jgi:predicted metalloprotease with PDZ domain